MKKMTNCYQIKFASLQTRKNVQWNNCIHYYQKHKLFFWMRSKNIDTKWFFFFFDNYINYVYVDHENRCSFRFKFFVARMLTINIFNSFVSNFFFSIQLLDLELLVKRVTYLNVLTFLSLCFHSLSFRLVSLKSLRYATTIKLLNINIF